jgi:hypothetical protein
MDNIIGLPNIINKTLSTKEKINIFISRFVIKESNITIFILVKTPKFLFIKSIVSSNFPFRAK